MEKDVAKNAVSLNVACLTLSECSIVLGIDFSPLFCTIGALCSSVIARTERLTCLIFLLVL